MQQENHSDPTKAPDLYTLEPCPGPVSEQLQERLKKQAKQFHQQYEKQKKSHFFDYDAYYIISKRWFDRWKVYVGYQQVNANLPTNKFFGSGQMPQLNEDIVDKTNKFTIHFSDENQFYNIALKPGLQQDKDYIFINEDAWRVFYQYDKITVHRPVRQTPQGKKVELYFHKINLIVLFNQFLRQVQRQKASKFIQVSFQISHYCKVDEMEELINYKLKDLVNGAYTVKLPTSVPLRFWLLPLQMRKTVFMNSLMAGCKANPTFTYKLYIQAQFMDSYKQLTQFDILPQSIIVAQMKQDRQDWCFFSQTKVLQAACSSCRTIKPLKCLCSCKYAAYCSKQCKYKDKSHHKFRCPNDAQSQQQQTQLTKNEDSRNGITGLRNLGNTCFMNSGLQCLSHVLKLTQYFLNDQYIKDINKQNKLGTQGQLSLAYGKMLKNLWYGKQSSYSPTQLKRAIGKFQSMFTGYNQHDSGQLVTYLLDGLHQDLNLVKVKPYVQSKDYDGRPDHIIAKQAWQNFLLRNKSKIVDLMYGQYRSIVDCPQCKTHSVQFDPFLMCQLPIINSNLKKIEVKFVSNHFAMNRITICYQVAWNWNMTQILTQIKKKLSLSDDVKLISYVASYASCQLIDLKRNANQVRKDYKYRTIYVRQLLPNQDQQNGVRVILGNTVCHSYYNDQSYRKSLTSYRMYFFNRQLTCKKIHQTLYSYYNKVYPVQNYQQEIVNVPQKQQPMRILLIPASKYSLCDYCKKKNCDGCLLPYSDQTLGTIIPQDQNKVQIQLYWRKNQKQIQKIFDTKQSSDQSSPNKKKDKAQKSLQDCFELFQQTQTLAQDNAWYCPQCKDFVLAKKQMSIYKAPKILILCLKRFKKKQYHQQKLSILVDFPIIGLDISKYVVNTDLPQQYFVSKMDTSQVTVQKMDTSQFTTKQVNYDLFGITNHFGGTGGGHYTAYCKNPYDNQWYDFDDSYVTKVRSPDDLVTQSAYILFYKRRQ